MIYIIYKVQRKIKTNQLQSDHVVSLLDYMTCGTLTDDHIRR